MAAEQKDAAKFINEFNKTKLTSAIQKAEEDSDEDDLTGWHLD